ncbi:MAG: 16S rRNA (guanine(966)-N(2))-methyltransferase RsmD [Arenimonas sp.]|nr:16S rRNA (guanine(966)-N(2))-methyltransferase RsmD [Arenimonas sp.]
MVNKTGLGHIRIIAGKLRGSKLPVLDQPGLRPTANRVRETLFNWLQHSIQGRHVLDLFAGSGALGFEAISRSAANVTMLESNSEAVALLEATKTRLKIENVTIIHADSLTWLKNTPQQGFDLVFLDPPFVSHFWPAIWPLLLPKLAANALLYIELSANQALPLIEQLHVLKQGETVQSQFFLVQ